MNAFSEDIHSKSKICFAKQELLARILRNAVHHYSKIEKKCVIFLLTLQEDQDWGIVAMVLDRLFLYVFGVTAFFGSLMILSESPTIDEEVSPIDVIYSKIAADESRMYEEKLLD